MISFLINKQEETSMVKHDKDHGLLESGSEESLNKQHPILSSKRTHRGKNLISSTILWYAKCPFFGKKKKQHIKKQENMAHLQKRKKRIRNHSWGRSNIGFTRQRL